MLYGNIDQNKLEITYFPFQTIWFPWTRMLGMEPASRSVWIQVLISVAVATGTVSNGITIYNTAHTGNNRYKG